MNLNYWANWNQLSTWRSTFCFLRTPLPSPSRSLIQPLVKTFYPQLVVDTFGIIAKVVGLASRGRACMWESRVIPWTRTRKCWPRSEDRQWPVSAIDLARSARPVSGGHVNSTFLDRVTTAARGRVHGELCWKRSTQLPVRPVCVKTPSVDYDPARFAGRIRGTSSSPPNEEI